VALAVGAFLTVESAHAGSGPGSVSARQSYLDGNGPFMLVVAVAVVTLAVLLALGRVPRWVGGIVAALGLMAVVVVAFDVADVQDAITQVESIGGSASIGPALWVCLTGGTVAAVGGVLAMVVGAGDART